METEKLVRVTYSQLELMEKSFKFLDLLGRHAKSHSFDPKYSVHVYMVTEAFHKMYCED